ncbi:hypothetical protein EMCRGX_G025295 [Ephydatia muelleri]
MSKSLLVVFVAAGILGNFSSSGATCNSTVCSTDGETNAYTVQSRIAAFLDNQSQVSVNATQAVLDSIKQFILSSKFDLTNTMFHCVRDLLQYLPHHLRRVLCVLGHSRGDQREMSAS